MMIEQRSHTRKFLCAACAAMMAATFFLGGCAKGKSDPERRERADFDEAKPEATEGTPVTTDTTQTIATTVPTPDPTLHSFYDPSEIQGVVNGYEYTLTEPKEYGPDLGFGWYIRDTEDEHYVLVCNGMEYSGGYFIEVKKIEYDEATDTVVIFADKTRDPDIVTDAYTNPCCSVEFKELPDNIKVYCQEDNEMIYGGRIINTEEWAVDLPIEDDYVVIFSSSDKQEGYRHCTYVYRQGPDDYRYINVLYREGDPETETYVKGTGLTTGMIAFTYICPRFNSWSYALVKGEEDKPVDPDDFVFYYTEEY